MSVEVRVPTLGESVTEATVATWFKKPGDAVAVDEMLCELETDKVTVEVPSPVAGKLTEIVAAEGTTVGVNALLAQITEAGKPGSEDATPKKGAVSAPQADEGKMAGKNIDVMVPTLGESVTEATVSTWFKKPGDAVRASMAIAANTACEPLPSGLRPRSNVSSVIPAANRSEACSGTPSACSGAR